MFSTRAIVLGAGMALAAVVLPVTPPATLGQPANEVATQAFAILERNCANSGCHAGPGYHSFDVRNPATLWEAKVIRAGNAGESEVIRRLESGSMPLGGYQGQPAAKLPDADVAALRRWIDAGAPAVSTAIVEARPFVSEQDVLTAIVQDLETVPARDRRFLRYFSFANMWNCADLTESELASYPIALGKLVHHLSWERTLTQPNRLGPQNTLLRIDLRDYGWTNQTWRQIEAAYPYDLVDSRLLTEGDEIQTLSDAGVPYIRADWFIANASIAPLYHKILRLPGTLKGLENLLRIDSAADVKAGRARRFGLRNSGVSRNNRAIERSPTAFGAYWKSFDFASSRLEQNVFADPIDLHPDGGEVIFTLPNGLHGYFIVDKDGQRLDDAPIAIVRDRANTDDPVVHNGRSCIGCHIQGINAFRDEISAALKTRVTVAFDLSEAEDLYRGQQELDRLVSEDNRVFKDALLRVDGGRSSNGEEPISQLARRHDAPLTLAQAAADLFLDAAALQRLIVNSPDLQRQGFDQLLGPGGGIKRDTWEQGFRDLLREREPRVPDGPLPDLPTITLNTNLGSGATYHAGDDVVISVTPSTEGFIGLFGIDSSGGLRQLYPPGERRQARVAANETIRVVDAGRRARGVFGVETLIAVASSSPVPLENQSSWNSFAGSLRIWASSSAAPKRVGDQEIAILRFLTAP